VIVVAVVVGEIPEARQMNQKQRQKEKWRAQPQTRRVASCQIRSSGR
jgi:hypothetical protein